jgi:hypothetical protein
MSAELQEGDIVEIKIGHKVYADVPKHFLFDNYRGCFDQTARGDVVIQGHLDFLAGKYVVYKTCFDGVGSYESPAGHHVFCEKLNNPDVKIDFYQNGGFTAVIKDIAPIGKAIRKWVEK